MAAAKDFTLDSLIKTRDPRFEATFYYKPTENAKSCGLYVTKFIPRSALSYLNIEGGTPAPEFQGDKNVTGYPVMRYAEVLLNWIDGKSRASHAGRGGCYTGRHRQSPSTPFAKGRSMQRRYSTT